MLLLGLMGRPACAADWSHIRLQEFAGARLVLLAMNPISADRSCVAGYLFDPEEAKSTAVGLVMGNRTAEVHWHRAVKPGHSLHQNRFAGCFELAGRISFVEESDTQASAETNQVLVDLATVNESIGHSVERRPLWRDGRRSWLVGLASNAGFQTVVLGHVLEANSSAVGMSIHRLTGELLVPPAPIMVKNGSFLPGSRLASIGNQLRIAGRFTHSGRQAESTLAKAAISQAGRYIWAKPLSANVLVTGPDKDGRLYEVNHARELGRASIAELGEESKPIANLQLPDSACVLQWHFPHVALVSKSCRSAQPERLTIQYLSGSASKDVAFGTSKMLYGPDVAIHYSTVGSGVKGFEIGVLAP